MARMFGTDGVRGVAGRELTSELAYALGQAGTVVLTKEDKKSPRILIGRDTRISGDMLECAMAAGICSVGGTAVIAGVMPTPAIAYLTRTGGFDAGVVISASHNSYEFNGIKFFDGKGYKLPDAVEDEIERLVRSDDIPNGTHDRIGKKENLDEGLETYIRFACSTIEGNLSGMNIVIDCANGASSVTAPETLRRLGADVEVLSASPDGININDHCGSTHMEALCARVKEKGNCIGIAFDGDADRMLAVDENGNMVDGDQIMTICGLDMKNRGILKKDTIVITVMSNMGMTIAADKLGLKLEKTAVGDRYVLENMLANDYSLGGEQSGHMIFLDHNTTGDGLVSALQLLDVMKRSGKELRELATLMRVLPQVLVNARIESEKRRIYNEDPVIAEEIRKLEKKYDGCGRVLIRLSGTEPLVRVMIEGEDLEDMKKDANALAELMKERLV